MRSRFGPSPLVRVAAGLALVLLAIAWAESKTPPPTHPTWEELSPAQREALGPLAGDWDKFDGDRKKKWVEIAKQYQHLSPEGQQHFHERMGELSKMTPQQRVTSRENFRRAYELPLDQRQALLQKYQELPPDRKIELAKEPPRPKVDPPRKPTRDAKSPAPPAKP